MTLDIRWVDPWDLRVPSSRGQGADPVKLARQIARFGAGMDSMPAIITYEGLDGVLVIYDGVTRATRIAKLAPAALVKVEVIGKLKRNHAKDPSIGGFI